jgi:hypothetical protein
MGKVIIKQGFLGLGRPIEKWYCDKCGVECQNQFYAEPQMYCRSCANAIDPDIVHIWPRDDIVRAYMADDFFLDTADGQQKLVEPCNRCLGLLVVTRLGASFQRWYYRLGSPHPYSANFPCHDHSGYDEHGNVKIQAACEHDFVVIGTSKQLDHEARSKYEHMMSHRNTMVESMFGTDEVDIQHHCFGATHFWCYKCGLHYSLSPQREYLLPRKGLIA